MILEIESVSFSSYERLNLRFIQYLAVSQKLSEGPWTLLWTGASHGPLLRLRESQGPLLGTGSQLGHHHGTGRHLGHHHGTGSQTGRNIKNIDYIDWQEKYIYCFEYVIFHLNSTICFFIIYGMQETK